MVHPSVFAADATNERGCAVCVPTRVPESAGRFPSIGPAHNVEVASNTCGADFIFIAPTKSFFFGSAQDELA